MYVSTTFLWGFLVVSTFLANVSEGTPDEQQRIAVRLDPPSQTLYSTVLQLPLYAAINVEVDIELSRIRSSNLHIKVFLLYSKGTGDDANHTLVDQPLGSSSYRHRMQLQLMTFNQFSVRVVVADQVA
jgi:hypothetical protein